MSSLKRKRTVENKIIKNKHRRLNLIFDEIECMFELVDISLNIKRMEEVEKYLYDINRIIIENKKIVESSLDNIFIIKSRLLKYFYEIEKFSVCVFLFNGIKFMASRFFSKKSIDFKIIK